MRGSCPCERGNCPTGVIVLWRYLSWWVVARMVVDQMGSHSWGSYPWEVFVSWEVIPGIIVHGSSWPQGSYLRVVILSS